MENTNLTDTVSIDIKRLLGILSATGKNYDTEKIIKAYEYAKNLHEGQFRVSGDPYISHPIAVAEIVAGLELDTDSICAALLHDTVEDCAEKTNLRDGSILKAFALLGYGKTAEADACIATARKLDPNDFRIFAFDKIK